MRRISGWGIPFQGRLKLYREGEFSSSILYIGWSVSKLGENIKSQAKYTIKIEISSKVSRHCFHNPTFVNFRDRSIREIQIELKFDLIDDQSDKIRGSTNAQRIRITQFTMIGI